MPLLAQSVAGLADAPAGRACLEWFRRERNWINEQHLKLCRIPAPTFFEEKRAGWMAEQFRALGWEAKLDRGGNVIATLPGYRDTPAVAVTAHLDTVLAPRTPEVDLYDGPNGKRVQTLRGSAFPACTPITGRAPNMMLRVRLSGAEYWVPPHMVRYRFAGNLPPVCRNLAMGSNEEKVGATRGLGEGCPKPNGGTP